jgi:hypothetical protein
MIERVPQALEVEYAVRTATLAARVQRDEDTGNLSPFLNTRRPATPINRFAVAP